MESGSKFDKEASTTGSHHDAQQTVQRIKLEACVWMQILFLEWMRRLFAFKFTVLRRHPKQIYVWA